MLKEIKRLRDFKETPKGIAIQEKKMQKLDDELHAMDQLIQKRYGVRFLSDGQNLYSYFDNLFSGLQIVNLIVTSQETYFKNEKAMDG